MSSVLQHLLHDPLTAQLNNRDISLRDAMLQDLNVSDAMGSTRVGNTSATQMIVCVHDCLVS